MRKKQKRVKYCLEIQPDLYKQLKKESKRLKITCLSKYLKRIILNRHLTITEEQKNQIKELYSLINQG